MAGVWITLTMLDLIFIIISIECKWKYFSFKYCPLDFGFWVAHHRKMNASAIEKPLTDNKMVISNKNDTIKVLAYMDLSGLTLRTIGYCHYDRILVLRQNRLNSNLTFFGYVVRLQEQRCILTAVRMRINHFYLKNMYMDWDNVIPRYSRSLALIYLFFISRICHSSTFKKETKKTLINSPRSECLKAREKIAAANKLKQHTPHQLCENWNRMFVLTVA